MNLDELQKRAGIVTEAEDVSALWKEYARISERLATALKSTGVDTEGQGRAPDGMLNPLQVNDIAYHTIAVNQQLDRLDAIYRWREYMEQRKSRMKVT